MTINIEELKRDRDAGTDGPWVWRDDVNSGEYNLSPGILVSLENDGTPWGDFIDKANARRLARVPDLEAAFLEAVEALQKIAAGASVSLDDDLMQGWRKIATDRINIARNFMERNT